MNGRLIHTVGRRAGITAAQTREQLLAAAADVFARDGYDGTRVAEIARAAGVSNGALYAHFGSKAELLAAAVAAHGPSLLAQAISTQPGRPVADMFLRAARKLRRRPGTRGDLVVEALAASRRDEDLAVLMREYIGERGRMLAERVRQAQHDGEVKPVFSPDAIAHLCLLIGLGGAIVTPDLHSVGDDEWTTLLTTVIGALAVPPPSPSPQEEPQEEES